MELNAAYPRTTQSVVERFRYMVWMAREDGSVEYFDQQAAEYAGLHPEELHGWGWLKLIFASEAQLAEEKWKQAIRSGCPYAAEYRLRRADGTYHWYQAAAAPVCDSNGQIQKWVGTWINIEDRKQAEKKLQESQARFEAVIESAMDAIIAIDETQCVVLFNAAAEKMFGCGASEAMGRSLDRFIPLRLRAAHSVHVRAFATTGVTSRTMGKFGDLVALRADGREFPIEASISQAEVGGTKLCTVILRDITQRKEAEGALRALAARLQRAREEEAIRIARELHDQLGRSLTSIKMDLLLIEKIVSGQPAADGIQVINETVKMMLGAIDDTVHVVRRISTELRPGILDDLGLAAAIEWQANDFQRRSAVSCIVNVTEEDLEVSREQATAFFRIFQEILTNVARHSKAGKIWVHLGAQDGEVVLEVEDDGVGISPEAVSQSHALGLVGMRERAAIFGGQVEIAGTPGKGTTVIVRMPINENPAR
jgi:PAS domain S-box-containing protein